MYVIIFIMKCTKLLVSKQKSDDNCFEMPSQAIAFANQLDGHVIIEIEPGIYKEKLELSRPDTELVGLSSDSSSTVLTFDDYAFDDMPDGSKRGTFRSYSVFIDADNVTVKNLTIENSSGDSKSHGQAIALYAEGNNLLFENCSLLGHQDTLFTGPLPPKELQKNGFIGPKQYAPRVNGMQVYKQCFICGDVDFIFGSATAYFEDCTIKSLLRDPDTEIQGYVTAASTAQGQDFGYIFKNCKLISDCPKASVYLGRPWRNFAKTIFINCDFGPHIHPDGFHDWNKADAHDTITYAEYNNSMEGQPFKSLAPFVSQLSEQEAAKYELSNLHN